MHSYEFAVDNLDIDRRHFRLAAVTAAPGPAAGGGAGRDGSQLRNSAPAEIAAE
jgi:hypothetical protein